MRDPHESDVGPDTPDAPESVPSYVFELEPDPLWEGACADWGAVGHPHPAPEPELPVAPLWAWGPEDDPRTAALGSIVPPASVGTPSISPDGSVWVVGPNPFHVMALEREGALRFVTRLVEPGPLGDNSLRAPVAMAPDGSGFVAGYVGGALFLFELRRDGRPTGLGHRLGDVTDDRTYNGQLTIGPHGLVYVPVPDGTGGTIITATCRGEPMWRLRVRVTIPGPSPWSGYALVDGLVAAPDGVVFGSAAGSTVPFALDEDGTATWPFGIDAGAAGTNPRLVDGWVRDVAGDRWNLGWRAPHVVDMGALLSVWTSDGSEDSTWLDALGRLWIRSGAGSPTTNRLRLLPLPSSEALWDRVDDPMERGLEPTADGDYLRGNVGGAIRTRGSDGSTAWMVRVSAEPLDPAAFADHVLDVDGRLYGTLPGGRIGAIQTDAEPVRGSFCLARYWTHCNRHRNNWAQDYDPTAPPPLPLDASSDPDAGSELDAGITDTGMPDAGS